MGCGNKKTILRYLYEYIMSIARNFQTFLKIEKREIYLIKIIFYGKSIVKV